MHFLLGSTKFTAECQRSDLVPIDIDPISGAWDWRYPDNCLVSVVPWHVASACTDMNTNQKLHREWERCKMEVHFSAEMFKQKPKQYHLPLESQAFLFSHITGFPCYGLLNARSRNTNHPIGNLAILLIHISYSLQLYSLHHLPRKSWDKCHHLLWSFVFYHSKNTKSPPERNRATTKIRITSAELRSDDSKFFFGTNDGFEKITCQWRIAAGENVGI